ncbi:GCN5-related N-acetyltransferase [Burkholderia sp. H160]|nr:GCN5-related N-acetyltransferase [Burkholderia sp. H160]
MPNFRPARPEDYVAIRVLLAGQALPSEDVVPDEERRRFHEIEQDGQILGCAGLEVYGTDAILRSVAVTPSARGGGLGRALVGIAERDAAALGVQRLFLLTTNAARYFSRIGYRPCARSTAPPPVQASSQFSRLCTVAELLRSTSQRPHDSLTSNATSPRRPRCNRFTNAGSDTSRTKRGNTMVRPELV